MFILLVLPLQGLAFAQNTAVPRDPKANFADGVVVIDSQLEYTPLFDNTKHLLSVFKMETNKWESFSYSETFASVSSVLQQQDGTIGLAVTEKNAIDPKKSQSWSFDPTTNSFSRYENACIDADDSILFTPWTLHTDPKINRVALCFTGTGQSEYLLPQNVHWEYVMESQNADWLILFASPIEEKYNRGGEMYSYHIPAHKLIHVGTIPVEEEFYLAKWISPTAGMWYSGGMPESFPKSYYYFDLSIPESLNLVISGWAKYADNPPRYDYLQTFYDVTHRWDVPYAPLCEMYTFSFDTLVAKDYPLGQDCFGRVLRVDDQYYYASYTEDASAGLSLFSFDINCETKTTILKDDNLVALESVSPDGRYAFLMLHDGNYPVLKLMESGGPTGTYPPLEELDPFYYDTSTLEDSTMGFYDLKIQKWVYRTASWPYGSAPEGIRGDIHWIDVNHFFLQSNEQTVIFALSESGLEQVNQNSLTINPSPNNQRGIIWNEATKTLEVIDLLSGSRRLIAGFPSTPASCGVGSEWINASELKISTCIYVDESNDKTVTMTYHIHIPN